MTEFTYDPEALGYVVLYGTTSTRPVPYDEARAALIKHGLSDEFLPAPTRRRAFSRTMRAHQTDALRARNVVNDPAKMVTYLVHELREAATEELGYEKQDRAEFDKKAQKIVVSGDRKRLLEADFEQFSVNVVGDDVRQMTKHYVESLEGISLRGSEDVRDAGGVYFVPIQHREQIQALANVLEDELHVGYLRAFGVIRGTGEEIQIAISAEFYIERELADIVAKITDVKSRASAVVGHRKQLERLDVILRRYATLSGRPASAKIAKKIKAATRLADEKITQLTPAKPQKSKRPAKTKP
jgi:hypothetical protein